MPLISFSGDTALGPFWYLIQRGEKTQTCREPRKRPIKKDDVLYLYWRIRVPKDKKPMHFIGCAKCISVQRMKYGEFAYDEKFARRDGFTDSKELREWFGDIRTDYGKEYDVIQFRLYDKLSWIGNGEETRFIPYPHPLTGGP